MENETYKLLEQRLDNFTTVPGQGKTVEEIDLYEYQTHFKYALRALSWKNTPRFYLCFFQPLDYVVPYAAQTSIPLIVDLQDNLINNIYNLSEEYKLEQLHVAVFPLKETSAIMLFYEQGEKRYRKFMKQLKRLDFEDQLAVINFLIFSYTENVFINPTVYNTVWENSKFREVCRKTTSAKSSFGIRNPLRNAMQSYSFSNRDNVPNLLSRDYALVRPQDVS